MVWCGVVGGWVGGWERGKKRGEARSWDGKRDDVGRPASRREVRVGQKRVRLALELCARQGHSSRGDEVRERKEEEKR